MGDRNGPSSEDRAVFSVLSVPVVRCLWGFPAALGFVGDLSCCPVAHSPSPQRLLVTLRPQPPLVSALIISFLPEVSLGAVPVSSGGSGPSPS